MKIVHVVGGDLRKGAHKGALWLHQGLRDIGVESSLLTAYTEETFGGFSNNFGDSSIYSLSTSNTRYVKLLFRSQLDKIALLPYHYDKKRPFSTGFFGGSVSDHPLIRDADIINIHWVSKVPISLYDMSRLRSPVVLTLRDMWPFTGGCHYAMECDRYLEGCGQCPQLGSNSRLDLSKLVAKAKAHWLPKNLTCVGISNWISECAKKSFIFKNQTIHTISNCIDTDVFSPISTPIARNILNLPTDRQIILVGAESVTNFYKGFDLFLESLHLLKDYDPLVVFFGKISTGIINLIPFETLSLGYINDDRLLRIVYSSADVFVAPSKQEAFGKTLAESMACGTPVVCFNTTGPKDIVKHQYSGYKAKAFDTADLAQGIIWVLQNSESRNLRPYSRSHTVKNFSKEIIAKETYKLYSSILSKIYENKN